MADSMFEKMADSWFSFHTLRHTFVTILFDVGIASEFISSKIPVHIPMVPFFFSTPIIIL